MNLFQRYFFVGLAAMFLLSSCENNDRDLKNVNSRAVGVEELKNVDINYSIGGKIKAKLLSPKMLRIQDTVPYVEFPISLHVDFYDITSKIESRLDAKYGKYFETQGKVFLKDSVKVINVKGDTLYCEELYWDRTRIGSEFYTDKPVKIRTKEYVLNGIGMNAPQNFKTWQLLNPTGPIKVSNSEFPDN